jgi:hypothetical protein
VVSGWRALSDLVGVSDLLGHTEFVGVSDLVGAFDLLGDSDFVGRAALVGVSDLLGVFELVGAGVGILVVAADAVLDGRTPHSNAVAIFAPSVAHPTVAASALDVTSTLDPSK